MDLPSAPAQWESRTQTLARGFGAPAFGKASSLSSVLVERATISLSTPTLATSPPAYLSARAIAQMDSFKSFFPLALTSSSTSWVGSLKEQFEGILPSFLHSAVRPSAGVVQWDHTSRRRLADRASECLAGYGACHSSPCPRARVILTSLYSHLLIKASKRTAPHTMVVTVTK